MRIGDEMIRTDLRADPDQVAQYRSRLVLADHADGDDLRAEPGEVGANICRSAQHRPLAFSQQHCHRRFRRQALEVEMLHGPPRLRHPERGHRAASQRGITQVSRISYRAGPAW